MSKKHKDSNSLNSKIQNFDKAFDKLDSKLSKIERASNIINDSLDKSVSRSGSDKEVDKLIAQIQSEVNLENKSKALEAKRDQELAARLKALKGPIPTEQELQDRFNKLRGDRTASAQPLRKIQSLKELNKPLKTPISRSTNLAVNLSKARSVEHPRPTRNNIPNEMDISGKSDDVKQGANLPQQSKNLSFVEKVKNFLIKLIVNNVKAFFGKPRHQDLTAETAHQVSDKKYILRAAGLANAMRQNLQDLSKNGQDLIKQQALRKSALIIKQKARSQRFGIKNSKGGMER